MRYPAIHYVLVFLAAAWSLNASAGNANQYRSAFLETCQSEGDDLGVCACVFDDWVATMDDPSAPGAVTAARLVATGHEREPSQQEAAQAAPYMGQLGMVSDQCVKQAYGDQYARASERDMSQPQPSASSGNDESSGGGGLLGGIFGVVGDKLGVAKDVTQAAAKGTGSLLGKMNPFKKDDGLALTDRPVADYEPLFSDYCMKSWEQESICACRWDRLTSTLGGVDTAQTRTVAYMASHDPGDLNIPEGAQVDQSRAMQTLSQYLDTAASCSG